MSKKEDGGNAFPLPCSATIDGGVHWGEEGMTLRDYFAAKAMQGMIATHVDSSDYPSRSTIANLAYEYADAMLEARK